MKHRHHRQFRRVVASRRVRVAAVAVALLAGAATTGILLDRAHRPGPATGSAVLSVAGLTRSTEDQASRAEERLGSSPTPDSSPAAVSSAAPTAPAAPVKPATTAPRPPKPPKPAAPPSSKVLDYQFELQINYYYCGPAATRIALSTRGVHLSQDDIAGRLGTTTSGTNSAEDTTRVLNSLTKGDFYRTTSIPGGSATPAQMDKLQADVVHAVGNGYGVVVNIAGTGTDVDGGQYSSAGGHYIAVIGYRDGGRVVKIADPANPNGDGTYWITTINLANWAATRGYSA